MNGKIVKFQGGFQNAQSLSDRKGDIEKDAKKLREDLELCYPNQNLIKIKDKGTLVKMASGTFSLNGVTILEKLPANTLAQIRCFLLPPEDENDLIPDADPYKPSDSKKNDNELIPDDNLNDDSDDKDGNDLIPD